MSTPTPTQPTPAPTIIHPKHAHLGGTDRRQLLKELKQGYKAGYSIRALADMHRRSYGNIRALLLEAGVTLRPRGRIKPRKK